MAIGMLMASMVAGFIAAGAALVSGMGLLMAALIYIGVGNVAFLLLLGWSLLATPDVPLTAQKRTA